MKKDCTLNAHKLYASLGLCGGCAVIGRFSEATCYALLQNTSANDNAEEYPASGAILLRLCGTHALSVAGESLGWGHMDVHVRVKEYCRGVNYTITKKAA